MQQEELIACFNGLIATHKVILKVNEPINEPIKSPIALDVEHDESGNFVGVGFTSDGVTVWYYSDLQLFRSLDLRTVSLICHNGRTDFDCLRSWGIDVSDNQLVWDTELMAHILDSSCKGYGLKKLAQNNLNIMYPSYDDIVGKRTLKQVKERKTLDKQPLELVSKYNSLDVVCTWKLYVKQKSSISQVNVKYFEEIERPIAFVLQDMENRGICVDLQYLKGLKRELEAQKEVYVAALENEFGPIMREFDYLDNAFRIKLNLNSPKQLLEALHEKEIYPEFKGKPSTDKRALGLLADNKIVSLLLKYSEIDTLCSNFVNPYLERGQQIIHPWFNQCGTRTGRLSCSNPNLLQIPKKTENGKLVRRMFTARPGMLLGDCDFGQIEPHVLAHLSKDPVLCQMFNNGIDFHDFTAERLSISRDRAKVLNLSVGYRATKYSVQRQLGGTLEEAQQQIDSWWGLFPALRRWQERLIYTSTSSEFCETLCGRRIKVEGLQERFGWKREAAERQLINNITQGSAAEIMKLAMLKIHKTAPNLGILVQVYDSLLFESGDITKDKQIVISCMEQAMRLEVPLTVDYKEGLNWGDCK